MYEASNIHAFTFTNIDGRALLISYYRDESDHLYHAEISWSRVLIYDTYPFMIAKNEDEQRKVVAYYLNRHMLDTESA